jgi:hypothetical protein
MNTDVSRKRSTQNFRQPSSVRVNLDEPPVTHLSQHESLKRWTMACREVRAESRQGLESLPSASEQPAPAQGSSLAPFA